MGDVVSGLVHVMRSPDIFIRDFSKLYLREYQRGVCDAIHQSMADHAGRSIVVMFPRQTGKNELQAQMECFLLALFQLTNNCEMVKVSPTWKPQTLNAMRRLERVLETNAMTKDVWSKESGYIYKVGNSRIYFFSGQPRANIVGATASMLLEVDEAQDVLTSKYDKEIAPMAASANATKVFWGTAWTSRTLLSRELRSAREQEKKDGFQRVFVMTANDIALEVPAYGDFVNEQVARLGRNHPMVKTQYFSEEIDAEGGLFPPERQALMRGQHPPQVSPDPDQVYAMTLDLAGEDETLTPDIEDGEAEQLATAKRDSTALSTFLVDLSTVNDPLIHKPTYRLINRREWVGVKHATLYGQIKALAELFGVRWLVVDSTGVGAGMASFLSASLGEKVIPFLFNSRTKSDLLWDFLGIIDSGRFKDFASSPCLPLCEEPGDAAISSPEQKEFWKQISFCEFEIIPGPNKTVRWGVPDGTRDPSDGNLVHDDLLISAAMVAILDNQDWTISGPTLIIKSKDPLKDLDVGF
jgi:hypothetical protein